MEDVKLNTSQASCSAGVMPDDPPAGDSWINLLVEYPAGQYAKYKIRPITKFKKLMTSFFAQNRLSPESGLRFMFDGQRIQARNCSVAEPPLFWAAPAPGGQGPGADSGSDLLGSAPAPG